MTSLSELPNINISDIYLISHFVKDAKFPFWTNSFYQET